MSTTTTETMPYLLLGSSQRAALHDALAVRIARWRERWSTATFTTTISVPETLSSGWSQFTHQGGALFSAIADGVALLHVYAMPDFIPILLGVDAHGRGPTVTSHEVADRLRAEMMRSLCTTMLQGMSGDRLDFEDGCGARLARLDAARKQRALPVSVSFGPVGGRWTVVLHPRVVESLAPRRRVASSQPLERRRLAIAQEQLRVEAVLGEVEVSLAELTSLSCDDVIVLDQALSQPAQLLTETGMRVCGVVLGSDGARLAVRVAR
jgi:flagellar motor switch/type III secretory pathway protein FliN